MKNPNSRKKGNTYYENSIKDKNKEIETQKRTFNKTGYTEDEKNIVKENTEVSGKEKVKQSDK